MPGMTDRDTFAAAALTGLLARGLLQSDLLATDAYKVADAMLRERSRSGKNATDGDESDAKCPERGNHFADAMLRERCRGGGDCPGSDNAPNLDAAPAARGDARECTAPVTTGGTQWLNYNANDYVRVKLTAHGRELLKKQHESLNAMTAYLRYLPPVEDADGWSKWQLHRLMSTFGAHTGMGLPLCFEPTIQFDSARANLDAAPAARASEATASPERVRVRGDAGTGDTQEIAAYARFAGTVMDWISEATSAYASSCSDGGMKIMAEACSRCWAAFDRIAYPTDHGASPEARASVDSDRTDKAAPRPSEGTGDTQEPVAWAVMPVNSDYCVTLSTRKEAAQKAAERKVEVGEYAAMDDIRIVPLYRSPTLTDAERQALERELRQAEYQRRDDLAAILRGLLERLS